MMKKSLTLPSKVGHDFLIEIVEFTAQKVASVWILPKYLPKAGRFFGTMSFFDVKNGKYFYDE